MAGVEHGNVTNEEFMEEVARYDCVYNRNSKDFKDKNKKNNSWQKSPKFLSLHKYFSNPKPMFSSFGFEADVVVALGLKEEINLLAAKVPPRCPPCCLHRSAQRARTFNISAERNLWLQSALRSSAIIWKQLSFAIV